MGKWTEDDYYDPHDDDGGWDDDDAPPLKVPQKGGKAGTPSGGKAPAKKSAPAAAAAKPEPAAIAKHTPSYPPTPAPGYSTPSAQVSNQPAFDFNTPSPDTQVLAARSGKQLPGSSSSSTPSSQPASFIGLAPSKAMLAANKAQLAAQQGTGSAAASGSGSAAAVTAGVAGLGISGGPSSGVEQQGPSDVTRRCRVADFVLEPALAAECAVAAAAEATQGGGSRQGIHLVVLGHVDAGKSTLMGRLLHDLGVVSAKDMRQHQREATAAGKGSFAWAWVLDERAEERARGVTVDVATTRFVTPRYNVTLLDAPGHKDFVPNMITGAAQADAALLVVDGSPGGFEAGFQGTTGPGGWCGQTREHAQLARSLGVDQLTVVVSKLDMAGYSQERFLDIQSQLLPFLTGPSCGFKQSSIQWLPAVGPAGENLVGPPSPGCGLAAWWQGPCLVDAIDSFHARERVTNRPVRLPVADVFRNKAGVQVVGGKLEAGAVKVGSRLVVVPGGELATVKGIEVDGQAQSLARAGDAVELSLTGASLDVSRIPQGALLCHLDYPVPSVTRFEARVLVLEVSIPLLRGQAVTLHAHSAREAGHLSALVAQLNPRTGEVLKARPRCLLKGQSALVEVTLVRGMCLEEYADFKSIGRVALRDGGKTLAVGVVTQLLA